MKHASNRFRTLLSARLTEPAAGPDQSDDYQAFATLRGNTFDVGGQSFQMLPGMRGAASIVVERRTIAEWILAPLFRMIRG